MVDKGEGEGFGDSTLSGLAQLSRIPVEVLDGTPVLCLHRQRLAWRFDSMGTAKSQTLSERIPKETTTLARKP